MLDDLSVTSDLDDLRVRTDDGDLRVIVYDDDIKVQTDAAIAINGADGAGVNPGGVIGQVLVKKSGTDFDTEWQDPAQGVPPDGVPDQVLTKLSGNPFDTEWRNVPPGVPDGGITGQVLAKTSDSGFDMQWITTLQAENVVSRAGDTMSGPLVLDADPAELLGAVTKQYADTKAPLTSPVFSGQPTGPTAPPSHDGLWLANTEFVQGRVEAAAAGLVAKAGDTMSGPLFLSGAPSLGSHAVTKDYADTKAPLASPSLTGTPIAPTPASGTNTDQLATAAFVQSELDVNLANYLPKVGGAVTGPITLPGNPALDLQAATKQYVDASPGQGPYALEFDTISRSNLSRWNDHLSITEIAPVDVTGSASTAHTAILGAFAKAIARGRRSVIHMPAGRLVCGAPLNFLNSFASTTQLIELVGEGKTSTLIVGPGTGGHLSVINIGDNAQPQTGNLKFRDFTIAPAGVIENGILMHNARKCDFINMHSHFCKYFLRTGTAVDTLVNSVNYINFHNCSGNLPLNGVMFYPNTIQVLAIVGGEYTGGAGRKFFLHDSTNFNVDGLYIRPNYTEQFEYAVDSVGDGIVNLELTGGQWDRAITWLRAKPPVDTTGSNRNWVVHDTQLLSCFDDAIIWDSSANSGSTCEGLNVSGVNIHRIRKRILNCPKGSGVINGITARTCGYTETELINLGAEGNFEIGIVQAHMGKHEIGGFDPNTLEPYLLPTWGIVYEGASTGKRGHTAMRAWDATLGTYTGTP